MDAANNEGGSGDATTQTTLWPPKETGFIDFFGEHDEDLVEIKMMVQKLEAATAAPTRCPHLKVHLHAHCKSGPLVRCAHGDRLCVPGTGHLLRGDC